MTDSGSASTRLPSPDTSLPERSYDVGHPRAERAVRALLIFRPACPPPKSLEIGPTPFEGDCLR